MRDFPPSFIAEMARRDGAAPVWLLRFAAGGIDYVLCQDAITITPWGITALPLISSWGQLTQGVTGSLADFHVSDLSVNLINDPDASPNLRTLAKAKQLHCISVSVYLWYDGISDPPQEMERMWVIDIDLPSEAKVVLSMQDASTRYETFFPGTVITSADYPDADPDEIGKVIPLVFGTVKKLLTRSIDAGIITNLAAGVSASATLMLVSDSANIHPGMVFTCDDEDVRVDVVTGSILSVTRSMNATVPVDHQKGSSLVEIRANDFAYLIADHPVSQITKVWGRVGDKLLDISAIVTVYTGQAPYIYPGFDGQAVVTVPGLITLTQAILLDATVTGNIAPGTLPALGGNIAPGTLPALGGNIAPGVLQTLSGVIASSGTTALSGNITDYPITDYQPDNPSHSHSFSVDTNQTSGSCPLTRTSVGDFNISFVNPGVIRNLISYAVQVTINNPVNLGYNTLTIIVGSTTYITDSTTWSSSLYAGKTYTYNFQVTGANMSADSIVVHINWGNGTNASVTVNSATRAISTTSSGSTTTNITKISAVKTSANNGSLLIGSERMFDNGTLAVAGGALPNNGTLAVAGGSLPNNGTLAVAGGALPDNGNLGVTISGNSVANTLIGDAILVDVISPITAPQDVISLLHGTPCSVIGTWPIPYTFSGAITSSQKLPEWCHTLARQCRSYFRYVLGVPTLIVRPDALAPVHSINEIRLSSGEMVHSQRLTDINDVINTINLRYNRDWSKDGSGAELYQDVITGTDAASITTYGVRERPELFQLDFVTDPAVAADLLQFYLRWQSFQRWKHVQECYLFEAALEFADPVSLAFLEGETGEVIETGFNPGSGRNIDKIQLTVIE